MPTKELKGRNYPLDDEIGFFITLRIDRGVNVAPKSIIFLERNMFHELLSWDSIS